jgi:hypothetical protein
MINKIKEALITRWSNQLGIKDEKVFEGVAISVEPLITSDEQLTQFVEGAKSMLTQPQSYADKVRTELNAKLKEAESAKAELEAKLNGNNPPELKSNETPDFKAMLADALAEVVNPLKEELATLKGEKASEVAVKTAREQFFADEWVNGYPELRDAAWQQAIDVYEDTERKYTAEQLHEKAMKYFKPLAKAKGLDITKPFQSDGGAGGDDADFSAFDKAAEKLGWVEPK